MKRTSLGALAAALSISLTAVVACTTTSRPIGEFVDVEAPSFIPTADDGDASTTELRSYCPSDRCPAGHTTCPGSQFLCDVDLLSDPQNCGECGNVCPTAGLNETYACVNGRCTMTCRVSDALDCDGVPDNGCETSPLNDDHCGACGNKCPADKPCINRGLMDYACGCNAGELSCPDPSFPIFPCVDPNDDDKHCGACNNACPPEGDGTKTALPNTYFGCVEAQCGELKCSPGFADCDLVTENGCETPLVDNDNCGACGNKCQDGQRCGQNLQGVVMCMCPAGQTFCGACVGESCFGGCYDLTSDKDNCGACGVRCSPGVQRGIEACVYGECQTSCHEGWDDCNGNRSDGCETHIASDPNNCGGCGIVCDGIAGQACVDGQCMVEPCDVMQDAGVGAR